MFFEKLLQFFTKVWKCLTFSPLLEGKTRAKKIAYLGIATAFSVIVNTLFEVKLGSVQYSLTIATCVLLGILMGAGYGFTVCFIGDGIGFALHPFGAYMPWIGISNGITALLAGCLLGGGKTQKTWGRYVRTFILCVLSFTLCTVGITNTAFFRMSTTGVDYWTFFATRFFVEGQIWSCLVNYVVIFTFPVLLKKLPFLSNTQKSQQ